MGIGSARGEDRAVQAAELAISPPLLEASIDGAHGVLLSISGGSDLGLFEINEAARLVQEAAHPEANIIFGTVIDDALGDEVRVTVIAAGFDGGHPKTRADDRPWAPSRAARPLRSHRPRRRRTSQPRRSPPVPCRRRRPSRSVRRVSRPSTRATTSTSPTSSAGPAEVHVRLARDAPRGRRGVHLTRPGRRRATVCRFSTSGRMSGTTSTRSRNRSALASRLGVAPHHLVHMDQVHGADVVPVRGPADSGQRGDAMVSTTSGLALVVLVADCVPILFADPAAGVCAVAHAGRAGFAAGSCPAVVAAARAAGSQRSTCRGRPLDLPALLRGARPASGPGRCREPGGIPMSWTGTAAVDIAAGVVDQLQAPGGAHDLGSGLHREDGRYYSHRRGAPTGRFAGVVRLGPAPSPEDDER